MEREMDLEHYLILMEQSMLVNGAMDSSMDRENKQMKMGLLILENGKEEKEMDVGKYILKIN